MKRTFWFWLLGIAVCELVSAYAVFHPSINNALSILLAIGLLSLTILKPTWALGVVGIEYLIGSKGALFKYGGDANNDGGIAIRVLFFAAFVLGWLVLVIRYKTWKSWLPLLTSHFEYVLFLLFVIYAFALGFSRHNPFLLVDANAWGAMLLLLPALDIVMQDKEEAKRTLMPAFAAGLAWLPVKTLATLYAFTHGLAAVDTSAFYLWLRRTGVGEITALGDAAYRVFFQSHVYALFVVIAFCAWFAYRGKTSRLGWALFILSFAEVIASLSRSLWIGLGVALVFLTVFILRRTTTRFFSLLKNAVIGKVAALALLLAVLFIPPANVSLTSFFGSRVDASGAAATSRWNLLPILWHKVLEHPIAGSGFGATVTYRSADPRVVQETGGEYTTYAFEWGWMDLWIKFGIFGVAALLFLLWRVGKRAWSSGLPEWMRLTIIASLVALAATHFFTPYLNHPLGIFALIVMELAIALKGTLSYDPRASVA